MKHNTIKSRPKDESNHDDRVDDIVGHDNTISHDHTCVLKEDFNSYQLKRMKKLQTVLKMFFLKNYPLLKRT